MPSCTWIVAFVLLRTRSCVYLFPVSVVSLIDVVVVSSARLTTTGATARCTARLPAVRCRRWITDDAVVGSARRSTSRDGIGCSASIRLAGARGAGPPASSSGSVAFAAIGRIVTARSGPQGAPTGSSWGSSVRSGLGADGAQGGPVFGAQAGGQRDGLGVGGDL